ncbi:DUF4097 domain-containing protein [Paenibacillus sp. GCM10027626]|uniref:DUF4097 family beta strand repeat-containing protein n=1 Tax=Paenibacillus sp. GCM10027626 TaxID=3273411 RepID=UPI00364519EA
MQQQKRKKRQYWRVAQLCSFLIPGGGHLLLGSPLKGLLILTGTLIDLAAMVRYASEGNGNYTLLIVYLGLAIPVFWFYSVFDMLQLTAKMRAKEEQEPEIPVQTGKGLMLQGFILAIMGLLLLILVHKVSVRTYWLSQAGIYAPGISLAVIAALLVIYRGKTMFKMGRLTAAAVILTVGGLLLSDQIQHRNDIELLGQWWPAAFVLLGLEVVVYGLIYRSSSKRLSFDLAGSFLAVVIAVAAFGVTQYAAMPFRWLDQWKDNLAGMVGFSEEKGFKYELEMKRVPLPAELTAIEVNNPNGEVQIKPGDVERIEIRTVMWVDSSDEKEAQEVKANSEIAASEGDTLVIEAKGATYGVSNSRKPRMNMVITIPAQSQFVVRPAPAQQAGETFDEPVSSTSVSEAEQTDGTEGQQPGDMAEGAPSADSEANPETEKPEEAAVLSTELAISVSNGTVKVAGLYLPGGLKVKMANGEIAIHDLEGNVTAETKNGSIEAADIAGNAHLETYNGNVSAARITGNLEGSTLSGSMNVAYIEGKVEVATKNGQIDIKEALSSVKADTLNGDIAIASSTVGGNWNIDSSIGEIRLMIPDNGSYSVNGSVTFGTIATDLPLDASKKTITGEIGGGEFRINVNANSSITVNRYNPHAEIPLSLTK